MRRSVPSSILLEARTSPPAERRGPTMLKVATPERPGTARAAERAIFNIVGGSNIPAGRTTRANNVEGGSSREAPWKRPACGGGAIFNIVGGSNIPAGRRRGPTMLKVAPPGSACEKSNSLECPRAAYAFLTARCTRKALKAIAPSAKPENHTDHGVSASSEPPTRKTKAVVLAISSSSIDCDRRYSAT